MKLYIKTPLKYADIDVVTCVSAVKRDMIISCSVEFRRLCSNLNQLFSASIDRRSSVSYFILAPNIFGAFTLYMTLCQKSRVII